MASFALIKELYEKTDKNGNGYPAMIVIGRGNLKSVTRMNIRQKFGDSKITANLRKTVWLKLSTR